jgi:hypothetical protein
VRELPPRSDRWPHPTTTRPKEAHPMFVTILLSADIEGEQKLTIAPGEE